MDISDNKQQKLNTHGGKRENAGRKPKYEGKAVKFLGYTCSKIEREQMLKNLNDFKKQYGIHTTADAIKEIFLKLNKEERLKQI